MKVTACLIYLLLITQIVFGQSKGTDSLLAVLKKLPKDTNRVKTLNKLAFSYWTETPQKGIPYAQQALELADSLDFERGRARAFNVSGVLKWSLGDLTEAIDDYEKSLEIATKLNDPLMASYVYNNIAMIYSRMKNYDDALLFYGKSLDYEIKTNNEGDKAKSLTNIGLVYLNQGAFDKSLSSLKEALAVYQKVGDDQFIGMAFLNIGFNYANQKKHKVALNYYRRSEEFYAKSSNKRGLANLYTNMGNTLFYLHRYTESKLYLEKGLNFSLETGMKERLSESYLSLSKVDSAMGNYQMAFESYKLYDETQIHLFEKDHARELNAFKARYELSEKEKENELLKKEASIQGILFRQQRLMLFGSFSLFLLATGLAFLYYRYYENKTKANYELKKLNNQILQQREELREANGEIQHINENLESLVKERTSKVEFQNSKLTEYAFFNAHKLRGPLARILGLIHLMKIDPGLIHKENIVDRLDLSSKELDNVVHEINQILEA